MAQPPAQRSDNVEVAESGSGVRSINSEGQAVDTKESPRHAPDVAENNSKEEQNAGSEEMDQGPAESGGNDKEECSFCVFMKAGPCGKIFAAWETCVSRESDAGNDFAAACSAPTLRLQECMDRHQEYYGIMQEVEKEREKQMEEEGNDPALEEGASSGSKDNSTEEPAGSAAPS